jgi:hypothetical protein
MASLAPKASILGFVEIICNILEGSLGGRFLILIRDVVHIGVQPCYPKMTNIVTLNPLMDT